MDRIIDSSSSGKTKKLMTLAKENHGVFVCANPNAMITKAFAYGLAGFPIISYYDYVNDIYYKHTKCYIDELENFVKYLGADLSGYTITCED